MKPIKVVLFSSEDFNFFKSPAFVGSEFLITISFNPAFKNQYQIAVIERSPTEKNKAPQDKEVLALLDDLHSQIPQEGKVVALFNTTQRVNPFRWQELNALESFNPEAFPEELTAAQNFVADFLLLKMKERQILAPNLPWKNEDLKDHTSTLAQKSLRKFYDCENPEIQKIIHEHDRKKKILVHVCCGPDAAGVIQQIKNEFDVVCFWYDPNIQPKSEYDLRLDAFLKVVELEGVPSIVGEYDVDNFLENIKGLEHTPEQGAKCSICYDMRLERAALEAQKQNCDLFTTTLAISPHKVQQKLKAFGEKMTKVYGVPYLARNFMKGDGFKESVSFTIENNIYRQDYCGCWFSLHEGGPEARALAEKLGLSAEAIEKKNYKVPESHHS